MTGVGLGRCGTAWVLLVALVADASASLSVIGTRFIYPAGVSALTIRVGNVGTRPALVQAWLDRGDETADPSAVTVPFILSPPLLRMDPQETQALQLRHTGEPLPDDRESLFWFNLLDIPPEPKNGKTDNYLQLAIRSRIKLFYRPAGVAAEKIAAEKALSWALAPTGNGLRVSNASARYITIDSITLNGQKHAAGMVAPFSSLEIAPKGVALRTLPAKFSFTTINDYGAVVNHNYPQ